MRKARTQAYLGHFSATSSSGNLASSPDVCALVCLRIIYTVTFTHEADAHRFPSIGKISRHLFRR